MTDTERDICARADAGEDADSIAAALHITRGWVYSILRKHRPDRVRKARASTSLMPANVLGLNACKVPPGQIASRCKISRAYVYRILAEHEQ
jgi:hypothetical protein